jgi:TetR/AcrR family transcriptional regulator, tetracycline repressor protein
MGRPAAISREELVAGALAYVDAHGLEELTLRALAPTIGVSHTAAYTHFPSKAALLDALVERVLQEIFAAEFPEGLTPREMLITIAVSIRTSLLRHPNLAPAFLTSAGMTGVTYGATQTVLAVLESAGLEGRNLMVTYQVLEAYVFGTIIYELGSDSDFLETRRSRYRSVGNAEASKAARSNGSMRTFNDEAFRVGFERLLNASGL